MKKDSTTILFAFAYTVSLLGLGYFSFGFWTTMIFASGFLGGFILWLVVPLQTTSYQQIRTPFILTFLLFVFGHKVEENVTRFQERLATITGVSAPEVSSPSLILLVLSSVGGWLFVPYLAKRRIAFGYYLAWTFFASMGITELAHFIFPFFREGPYSYFPGMASVIPLAPAAWWGMYRLVSDRPRHAP